MKVICREHKTCVNRSACEHSKPHKQLKGSVYPDDNCVDYEHSYGCQCKAEYLLSNRRKMKLKKLDESNL